MLITSQTILLIEEIVVLIQTIHPILPQEQAEKAAIITQILITLQDQETIVTLLLAPILQAHQTHQVEVCVPLVVEVDHDLLVAAEEVEEDNSFFFITIQSKLTQSI